MHFTQPTHSTPAARSSSALIRITTDSPRFVGSGRTDCALGRWGTNANWSEDRSHTPCLLGRRSRPRRSVLLAVGPRNGPADLAKRTGMVDQRCEPASDVHRGRGNARVRRELAVWPMELDSPDAGRLSDDFGSVSPPIQA